GLVPHEASLEPGRPREAHNPLVVPWAYGHRRGPAAGDLARALHQLLEALVVHREALLGQELLRELVGEAVGVVQTEGVVRVDPGRTRLLGPHHEVGEEPLTLSERSPEALLLGARPAFD